MKKESCEMTCEEEEEEKEKERCRHSKRTPLEANCKSEIHVKPKNKIIYGCPKTAQYFLAASSKCCGEIKVKYIGHGFDPKFKKVHGDLGTYFILNSGILFITTFTWVKSKYYFKLKFITFIITCFER
ncbi:hypothetical protein GNF51_15800 [Clostridium perfringens]|nr:hypothetical protein [Clostridium perfringens]